MRKELIQLQTANMFQLMHSNGTKEDWLIRENITDELLMVLPSNLSDEVMFKIIKFAREFELKAFNAGIQYGKTMNPKGNDPENPYGNLQLELVKEG